MLWDISGGNGANCQRPDIERVDSEGAWLLLTLSQILRVPSPTATIALVPSLGTTKRLWAPLLRELSQADDYDYLLFDLPGHGQGMKSQHVAIRGLAQDLVRNIKVLAFTRPIVVAGSSLGGPVAVEAARHDPDAIDGFISFNSALRFGDETSWESIGRRVRSAGTAAHDLPGTIEAWFGTDYEAELPDGFGRALANDLRSVEVESYLACCRGLAAYDARGSMSEISVFGMAIASSGERATPASGMRALADGSTLINYAEIEGGHLAVAQSAEASATHVRSMVSLLKRQIEGAA